MTALISALLGAINNPTRAAPLSILAYIKYPGRELQPHTLPDGMIQSTFKKWGFQYKARPPRPKNPPMADTQAIQVALNAILPPCFIVHSVVDNKTEIIIILEELT